jgi:hypothetical protein
LRLSVTILLAAAARWRFGHPTGQLLALFALGLILSDGSELLQALLESLVVNQTPSGGIGRHSGAIQSAPLSRGQFLIDRLM